MNNYQLKYSKTQVFNTRFAVKDMVGSGGGGTSPQYIKGVNPIYTTDATKIPIPIFFTADCVNQAIAVDISHLIRLSLSADDSVFIDCMDTLIYLQSKKQSALELFDTALEIGTIINKTDESLEQIEDKLTNGNVHGGYLCLVKLNSDISVGLTILTYVVP